MDSAHIKRHNLIDRYVMHRLEGDELERFERYMLDNPGILDEIEYARGLQEALRGVEPELRPQLLQSSGDSRLSRWLLGREYALAATVLLAVAVAASGSLWLNNRELADALSAERNPVAIAAEAWFEAERGSATGAEAGPRVIEHEPGSALLFQIAPGFPADGELVVTIEGQQTDFRWRSVATAGAEGTVAIVLTEIPAGTYWLSIKGAQSAEPPTQFEFEIVPAGD